MKQRAKRIHSYICSKYLEHYFSLMQHRRAKHHDLFSIECGGKTGRLELQILQKFAAKINKNLQRKKFSKT